MTVNEAIKSQITQRRQLSLDLLLKQFWQDAHSGVVDRYSGFHLLTLGYLDQQSQLSSCVVVLREADSLTHRISFHSDIRHRKIQALKNHAMVSALLYCPTYKTQWRLQGEASIQTANHYTKQCWDNIQSLSRQCYNSDLAPGEASEKPSTGFTALQWQNRKILAKGDEGYKNFCKIHINLHAIECLMLSCEGQARALWKMDTQKTWQGQWLNP